MLLLFGGEVRVRLRPVNGGRRVKMAAGEKLALRRSAIAMDGSRKRNTHVY